MMKKLLKSVLIISNLWISPNGQAEEPIRVDISVPEVGSSRGQSSSAEAPPPEKYSIRGFTEQLIKTGRTHGSEVMCRKGDKSDGIINFRYLEGEYCKIPDIAAMAVALCLPQNKNGFFGSGCFEYATQSLGVDDKDPETVLEQAKTLLYLKKERGENRDIDQILCDNLHGAEAKEWTNLCRSRFRFGEG